MLSSRHVDQHRPVFGWPVPRLPLGIRPARARVSFERAAPALRPWQRDAAARAERGLVLSERVGNLRRIRANPQSPVFNELVALTRKTLGAEPLLRDALQALGVDVEGAWIYGSYAKQTDTAGSDIDVMIVGSKLTLARVIEALLPVEELLGRKVNPVLYTRVEFNQRREEADSFVNRVLAQPLLPLTGTLHEPARAG